MDPSHRKPVNPDAQLSFPPPPTASGAAQYQETPLAGTNVYGNTGTEPYNPEPFPPAPASTGMNQQQNVPSTGGNAYGNPGIGSQHPQDFPPPPTGSNVYSNVGSGSQNAEAFPPPPAPPSMQTGQAPGQTAICPVCERQVYQSYINQHLDSGCSSYLHTNDAGTHGSGMMHDQAPPLPQRSQQYESDSYPPQKSAGGFGYDQPYAAGQSTYNPQAQQTGFLPPPQRQGYQFGDDDPNNPIHYTRDPHKLTGYLVPFPKPSIPNVDPALIPTRFLIYTPPPPPLSKPGEGEKEAKFHKVQRKWQEEVRTAKTSTAKTASWKGVKSKATKGIDWAMSRTTGSNLDFLGRFSGGPKRDTSPSPDADRHANDNYHEDETTHKTVGVEELVLNYPPTLGMNQEQIREEFVNTMLRTKTKAQRDAVISTGLMPVAFGIDILATLVWPFGGLGEIDTVWAYANIRGAKTARSVTKRLSSGAETGDYEKDQLRLTFTPAQRIELLTKYLAAECTKTDQHLFGGAYVTPPTETDVLHAIGWSPSAAGVEERNWEDEQWETMEVKNDLKLVMHKGAKEWRKWCNAYAKDPEKAMKK